MDRAQVLEKLNSARTLGDRIYIAAVLLSSQTDLLTKAAAEIERLHVRLAFAKAEALHEAAQAATSDEVGIPWDSEYDQATVATWLEERAEREVDQ